MANTYQPSSLTKAFCYKEQVKTIVLKQFYRWLRTIVFETFIGVLFGIYRSKDNFSSRHKAAFNTLVTASSLLLGLNLFGAFKGLAKVIRWPLLSHKKRTVRQAELILGAENVLNVWHLLWVSPKSFGLSVFCVLWIVSNLGAQTAIALINLTYSIEDGRNWNDTYSMRGDVKAPNLRCYFHMTGPADHQHPVCSLDAPEKNLIDASHALVQGKAHALEVNQKRSDCCPYTDIQGIINDKRNCVYYCRNNTKGHGEYAYRFLEYNPDDALETYPTLTNRVITASSSDCSEYPELYTDDPPMPPDGKRYYQNGTENGTIVVPVQTSAADGTTYIYLGNDVPQQEVQESCGPRCLWIWAYRNWGLAEAPTFFRCAVTVGQVINKQNDTFHEVPDGVARLAAASIALQGLFRGSPKWAQYQFYSWGNDREIHSKTEPAITAGDNMAEYAILSIATLCQRNPRIDMPGTLPKLGSRLTVNMGLPVSAPGLLVAIAVIHSIIVVIAWYYSRCVVIKDDSSFSTARLLRPLVNHLGASGTLLDGRGIDEAIRGTAGGVVYGPRESSKVGEYSLDIAEDIQCLKQWPLGRHPEGTYV